MTPSVKSTLVGVVAGIVAVFVGFKVYILVFGWPAFTDNYRDVMRTWFWVGWIPGLLIGGYVAVLLWRLTRKVLLTPAIIKRNRLLCQIGLVAIVVIALFLPSGTVRTRHLQQEVLLNTGETIIVHWTVDYSLQGDAGNPLDISLKPRLTKTLDFNYAGKHYRYHGHAGNIFLLAISPEGQPTLVLHPEGFHWDSENRYKCTTPYYAQLNPDDSGENWSFPPNIEPWLYELRGNLSRRIFWLPPSSGPRSALQTIKEEYSSERMDRRWLESVDPTYKKRSCNEGE